MEINEIEIEENRENQQNQKFILWKINKIDKSLAKKNKLLKLRIKEKTKLLTLEK